MDLILPIKEHPDPPPNGRPRMLVASYGWENQLTKRETALVQYRLKKPSHAVSSRPAFLPR
jgi:hypothetical protein